MRDLNATEIAVVLVLPGTNGWGYVTIGGVRRMCFFDPRRFVAPNRVPLVDDRALVYPGATNAYNVLYLLGEPT